MNAIDNRLREFRKLLGFTQKEIAAEIDVSLSSYRRYENGKLPIPSDKIEILVSKYELNANWLFTGRGTMQLKQGELSEPIRDSAESDYSIPGTEDLHMAVREFRANYPQGRQEILAAVISLLQAINDNT